MSKTLKKKTKLFESDFRLIRQSIQAHSGKAYTAEYIRKVHNGKRRNILITSEIQHYLKLKQEFEIKLTR